MCNNSVYAYMLNFFVKFRASLRARDSSEPREVARTICMSEEAGAGEGEVWLIHHLRKQGLTVLRQFWRSLWPELN